ncbi:MAG: immune inhibitor A domain-containing protein, partial [Candidatus Latescibacterota bacterium]
MFRALVLSSLLGLTLAGPLSAFASTGPFRCAGASTSAQPIRAAKPLDQPPVPVTGDRRVLIIFARFADDPTGWTTVPAWAEDLLDPAVPGSLAHYYETMSFGQLHLRGGVAPRCFASSHPAATYLPVTPGEPSRYGVFALEILAQADQEVDFSRFDGEGPDGVPGSTDDDGVVDAVFLVLADLPFGFLVGGATGIAALGFSEPFVTNDRTAGGAAVRVLPIQGTVQQAATSAQAAGALAHEYGHLLGLPDLYNTTFLQKAGAPPEEDSAGTGNWCLMGWGAGGWQANDGPTSLCAWSRLQLGWASVTDLASAQEELRLPEVGRQGDLYRIPIGGQSAFLFECRRRTSTWYDRHLPAEGLLIWRVDSVNRTGMRLDLECADGRWLDAGYPLGQRPDGHSGGDNLDYWAHDAAYATAHAGNLGDATDPFDGNRYTAFTPETNPSSGDSSLLAGIRVEGIRLEGDLALARVQARPAKLELQWLYAIDESGDELLIPGETADIRFFVVNSGNVAVQNVRVIASVVDPELELVTAEAAFGSLDGGQTMLQPVSEAPFPAVRLAKGFTGQRQLTMTLTVLQGEEVLGEWSVVLKAVSTLQLTGHVTDEEGVGLAAVPLQLQSYNREAGTSRSYSLISGADCAYSLDLPPGEYGWGVSFPLPVTFPADRAAPYGSFTLSTAAT